MYAGPLVRVERIVLVHRERRAHLRSLGVQHGVVVLHAGAEQIRHRADERVIGDGAEELGGIPGKIAENVQSRTLVFLGGHIGLTPWPFPSRTLRGPLLHEPLQLLRLAGDGFGVEDLLQPQVPQLVEGVDLILRQRFHAHISGSDAEVYRPLHGRARR